MRQFAAAGFRIWNLSREAKIIYSFFCGLSLLALFSSLLLYEDLVGPTLRPGSLMRVRQYYQTQPPAEAEPEAARPEPPGTPASGPAIALAEDAPAPRLIIAMPYRKLLEVTHFHLFTVPVFLLILTHLFMLTGASPRQRLLWITLGWLAATLHIAAPWLIRLQGPELAFLFPLSGVLLAISSLVLTVYPVLVMWRRPRRRHKRHPEATAQAIRRARADGRPVLAVGTTVVRTLEAAALEVASEEAVKTGPGETALFIRGSYPFRVVDSLVTNFHLPRSTLLALVMSFAGEDALRAAYAEAIRARYRFFSYGDAMWLTRTREPAQSLSC